MKVERTNYNDIQTNIPAQKKGFSIKADVFAFETLSKRIYSDSLKAAIRETMCNAYDANKEAGKENVPIIVHLPDDMEPWYSVKDCGNGMSGEFIEELYSTYFASTKQNSNESTGGFGIGSKSPFAVTDQFTVSSVHKGVRYEYVCSIENDGNPALRKVFEQPSIENSGVEIRFNVPGNNFTEFTNKFKEVALVFKVTPEVVNSDVEIPKHVKLASYTTSNNIEVFMIENGSRYGYGAPKVYMGNVAYPLDNKNFPEFEYNKKQLTFIVPIGTVNPAPSREELTNFDYHSSEIKIAYEEYIRWLGSYYTERVKNVKSFGEYIKFYDMYAGSPGFNSPKWRDWKIHRGQLQIEYPSNWEHFDCPSHIDRKSLIKMGRFNDLCSMPSNEIHYYAKLNWVLMDRLDSSYKNKILDSISPEFEIIVCDKPRDRWRASLKNAKHTGKFPWSDYANKALIVVTCGEKVFKKKYHKFFAYKPYVKFEDLPDIPKSIKSTTKVKPYKASCTPRSYDDLTKTDIDLDCETGVWAKMIGPKLSEDNEYSMLSEASRLGFVQSEDIIYVPKSMWEKFEKHSNWTYIIDYLENKTKISKDVSDIYIKLNIHNTYFDNIRYDDTIACINKHCLWEYIKHEDIYEYKKYMNSMKTTCTDYVRRALEFRILWGFSEKEKLNREEIETEIEKTINDFRMEYPLFVAYMQFLHRSYYDSDLTGPMKDDIIDYFKTKKGKS